MRSTIYVTADTHFGHAEIIRLCSRPFRNVEEMDRKLIEWWNETVGPNDLVYHIGDVSDYRGEDIEDLLRSLMHQLNGRKRLVMGNHDRKGVRFWKRVGFEEVYRDEFLDLGHCVLSHKPLDVKILGPSVLNVHGHTHNREPNGPERPNHFCVSVEMTNYRPVLIEDILAGRLI